MRGNPTGLWAGLVLAIPFLVSMAVTAEAGTSGTGLETMAQSRTETGQSGVGVRGTTGENSGGGETYPGSSGTSGAGGNPAATDGATSMGQPGSPEKHVQEAMKHAKAATGNGTTADAKTVAEHARVSKTHVEAAQRENPGNPHLQAALKSLDSAIEQGDKGDADKARKAAYEALTHLNAVK